MLESEARLRIFTNLSGMVASPDIVGEFVSSWETLEKTKSRKRPPASHYVARSGVVSPESIEAYAALGKDLNEPDARGRTMAHHLCRNASVSKECFATFAALGGDLNARDGAGELPGTRAAATGPVGAFAAWASAGGNGTGALFGAADTESGHNLKNISAAALALLASPSVSKMTDRERDRAAGLFLTFRDTATTLILSDKTAVGLVDTRKFLKLFSGLVSLNETEAASLVRVILRFLEENEDGESSLFAADVLSKAESEMTKDAVVEELLSQAAAIFSERYGCGNERNETWGPAL